MESKKSTKNMWLGAVLMISIIFFQGPALAADDGITLPSQIPFGDVEVGQTKTAELVIAHTADSNVQVDITLEGTCTDFSLGVSSITIPPATDGSVIIAYAPTEAGPCGDTVKLAFSLVTPFGGILIGNREVTVSGTGLAVEEPEEPAVDIKSILEFFDKSVAENQLKGKGRKRIAKFRIKMIRHLLVQADRKLQRGQTKKAHKILKVVYHKIDGKNKPRFNKDLARGAALSELADMVAQAIENLELET